MIMGAVGVIGATVTVYCGGYILEGVVIAVQEGFSIIAAKAAEGSLIYLTIPVIAG
jgi:hypothetical protein